ncbi:MAG TPA: hypothetical protein VK034_15080 [Enhygromyxa sp.]|nr:hypothetical protein [Enhygromyxa sp.]
MLRRFRILALGLALALPACGWIVGEITQQLHRQEALKQHVYTQDIDELWRQVRDLWTSHGCEAPEQPTIGETLACEANEKRWLRVDRRGEGHRVEIEVERTQKDAEGKDKLVRERDWELEWKLLERVEPDTASRIESEAEAKGAKAKKATRELEDAIEK